MFSAWSSSKLGWTQEAYVLRKKRKKQFFPSLCRYHICVNFSFPSLIINRFLQSDQIHVTAAHAGTAPAHGGRRRQRATLDWCGFKERLNDRDKSGLQRPSRSHRCAASSRPARKPSNWALSDTLRPAIDAKWTWCLKWTWRIVPRG